MEIINLIGVVKLTSPNQILVMEWNRNFVGRKKVD